MPKISVAVPHDGDPEKIFAKAGQVIEKTVNDFQGQDLHVDWSQQSAAFKFTSLGFPIDAVMKVEDKQVVVEVDLPMAAMMFKDRVEAAVTKNLTQALGGGD